MCAPRSLQCLQMVPMAYRSADERLCKESIAYDAGRGFRPFSELVARVKGERMHHMCNTGFAVRLINRLRELWLECRQAREWGPLPRHQLAHV